VGCACLCGDPTRNCVVNAQDGSDAQRVGLIPPLAPLNPAFDIDFCDVNGNGVCNAQDGSDMQRVGLIPPLAPLNPAFSVTGCVGYQGP
jgi:hypothetical protein